MGHAQVRGQGAKAGGRENVRTPQSREPPVLPTTVALAVSPASSI